MDVKPNITDFSHELLCHILQYLPLREILCVAMLCRKMLAAVNMHLQLCKSIDFCQDSIFGYMPPTITDDHLLTLLKKCPHLEIVYGLHPVKIERRRLRKRAALTIPGIIEALSLCFHLKAIETSDLRLFEAIMQHLPQIEIIGHFQNRNGLFPPQASQRLKLQPYPRISSLHLIGVEVPELTAMPHLQHLHLQCVRFTKLQPFRAFLAQNLKSFVMKHCIGPSVPQRYLSLIIALSSSPNLRHLELVRVPLLNGLFQRAVEDSYRHNGFVNLRTLVISGCKGILEADLGHLMIVASKNLETLYIQPSLTKDSLFVSLSFAQCSFPALRNLHLGYIDNLNSGEWSNDTLLSFGLAEVPDTPSSLTDSGMNVISKLFPNIKTLSVSNCPHLMLMYYWMADEDLEAWSRLTDLTLQKCHCLQLSSFVLFLSLLPNIQVVILNDMFREPPKGCSHVGLSAGTGLGMSSAVVSNQDEHIAVQGHHQEFEPPGDEENEEIDREFIDVENEDNPEPQFMVLQRDFFDGEHNEEIVDNPPLENEQDPIAENQELSVSDNEVNNSLPNENIVLSKNNILEDSLASPSSMNDKYSPEACITDENQSYKEQKDGTTNSGKNCKSSETVHVQKDILSNDSDHSETLKNNSYSENNNEKSMSERQYKYDYDPHKPSTSKAGSHLDYSDVCDDYKYNKPTKRLNEYSDDQNFNKKPKRYLTKHSVVKKDCNIISQNNSCHRIDNCIEFKENNSDHIEQQSSENSSCTQNISLSTKIDEIPENMVCYVLIERMDIKSNKNNKSAAETKNDRISSVGNSSKSIFVKNKHECPHLNADKCYSSESKITSNNNKAEINENHINENACNTFNSKIDNQISIDYPLVNEFELLDELPEKKFTSTVSECSKHKKISLYHSCNLPTENTVHNDEVHVISKSDKDIVNADILNSPFDKKSCDSVTIYNSISTSITDHTEVCINDNLNEFNAENIPVNNTQIALVPNSTNESHEVIKNDLNTSKQSVFIKESSFREMSFKNLKYDSLESSEIIKPCSVLITRIENVQTYIKKYFDAENMNKKEISSKVHHECYSSKPKATSNDTKAEINENCINKKISNIFNSKTDDRISIDYPLINEFEIPDELPEKLTNNVNDRTEMCVNDNINEFDTKNITVNTTKTALVPNSTKESLEVIKNDLNITEQNVFIKENSFQETSSKNLKHGLLESSKIIKPCSVPITRMENIQTYVKKYFNAENMNKKEIPSQIHHDHNFQQATANYFPALNKDENSFQEGILLQNLEMHNNCQPSTSSSRTDISDSSERHSRNFKKMRSSKYFKRRKSSIMTRNKDMNSSFTKTSSEDEIKYYPTPNAQVLKNNSEFDRQADLPECKIESSFPNARKFRKNPQIVRCDKKSEDTKFFISVPNNGSFEIINSVTGDSYQAPHCYVVVTEMNNESIDNIKIKSEVKNKRKKCQKSFAKQSEVDFNPELPSTSNSSSQLCNVSKSDYLNKCKKEINHVKCYKCKNSIKCECKYSMSHNLNAQKLCISNSDAEILLKQCNTNYDNKLLCQLDTNDQTMHVKVSHSSYTEQKSENESNAEALSENFSYQNNTDGSVLEIDETTPPKGEKSDNLVISIPRKRRKRKTITFLKRIKKTCQSKDKFKTDLSCDSIKNTKKMSSVPMISLISQGTQATSADIRRSVRRIRRAAAHRKTILPAYASKNRYSSKISAKTVIKRPKVVLSRPESHDKATSTSDPLLEDDAVQTLQLSSSTLLSFTVVSCGISDLIIERCPKLTHIEVQACRILKRFQFNNCPVIKRLNVSQCPKLTISALVAPVMSLSTDSYFLVSFEPCMQGYHPGEGEKEILSKTPENKSVLILHDFCDISYDGIQGKFREKLLEWLHILSQLHSYFHYPQKNGKKKSEAHEFSDYPWSHELWRKHGHYSYSSSSDFCGAEGRYQVLTNNPIFSNMFETHQLECGFPGYKDCKAYAEPSLISVEVREKCLEMGKKFVGFYIPVTESNQVSF